MAGDCGGIGNPEAGWAGHPDRRPCSVIGIDNPEATEYTESAQGSLLAIVIQSRDGRMDTKSHE